MKSILYIATIFLLFPLLMHAQAPQVKQTIEDKNAKDILKKVVQKMNEYKSLQIEFTINNEDKANKTSGTTKGTLLAQGNKYRIKLDKQIIYCDGKNIWSYLVEEKEVQIYNYDSSNTQTLNFTKLLADYEKNYRPTLIREEKKGTLVQQIIDLTPNKNMDYYKIRLLINKTSSQIIQMEFFFKEGNRITYKVDNYKPNLTITPSDFVFNTSANPSVEIIDMR